MIYTILVLLKDVIPAELPNHPVIQAVPKALNSKAMGEVKCTNISQFYPAGYIRGFDPEHIPPYEAFEYIHIRSHDFGYMYIQTTSKIPSPTMLISALNYLPEFDNKALFLDAMQGAEPLALMEHFISTAKNSNNLDQSTATIVEFYEMALKARYEIDNLIKAHSATQNQSDRLH